MHHFGLSRSDGPSTPSAGRQSGARRRFGMRSVPAVFVTFLFAGTLFALGPGAAQEGAADLVISDSTDDVALTAFARTGSIPISTPQEPLPATAPAGTEQVVGPADLVEVSVFGETPTQVSFKYKVRSFERTAGLDTVIHRLCFSSSATSGHYQFVATWRYSPAAQPGTPPVLNNIWLERLGEPCNPFGTPTPPARIHFSQFQSNIDLAAGEVTLTVHRTQFAELHPNVQAGELDPKPVSGDQFTDVHAWATGSQGPATVFLDGTDAGVFTFAADTGNELVRVVVPDKVTSDYGLETHGFPTYSVEIGSYQVVPITIENDLEVPIEPAISVTVVSGDEAKWEIRTLPSIPVGKRVGDVPGRETVSLVVNSQPTVSHKETLRLLVSALDPEQPAHLGASILNIVAVKPPVVGDATLYFHGTGDACNLKRRWINTLTADTAGAGEAIEFRSCDPQGGGGGGGVTPGGAEVSRTFHPDVPFSRDYVLSTTENAEASIILKSVVRLPDNEVPVDMVGDVTVEIYSGTTLLGKGESPNAQIGGTDTPFNIPVSIQGRILGGFGREVPDDKPLNIRVVVQPQSRTIEYCTEEVCTFEGEQDVPSPGGQVMMLLNGQSKIVLPIVASEPAGEVINITKSGALVSLRLSEGEPQKFTNPGRIVVYNLTVRNEGVNVDTARISATVNRTGWQVEILPRTEYPLKIGERRQFNVRVIAPADAREGERVRIDVFAASAVDPEATAKLPLQIEATTQTIFEDQELDPNLQIVDDEKDSPGAGFVAFVLAALGLAAVAARRRRF